MKADGTITAKITEKDIQARLKDVLQKSGYREAQFFKLAIRSLVGSFEEFYQQDAAACKSAVIIQFPERSKS